MLVTAPIPDSYLNESTERVSLNNFLKRPVLISDTVWTEGSAFNVQLNPWSALFDNAFIKNKLENFPYLNAKLRVKVLINASPFYYGQLLVSYRPLPEFNAGIITGPAANAFIQRSHRKHFYCYAAKNQGGEMDLPFIYHKNYLETKLLSNFTNMGELNLDSTGVLRNANSVVGSGVSVKVYVYAEEVNVVGSTNVAVLQSGRRGGLKSVLSKHKASRYNEEAGDNKPSNVAATISGALDTVATLPMIGPFAKVGSMAAGAASGLLNLFGFTNIPNVDSVAMYQPSAYPQHCTTEISVPIEKLTFDPLNELTIDDRVAGGKGEDELLIQSLVTREAYLDSGTWPSTAATDVILYTSYVDPFLFNTAFSAGVYNYMYKTPLAHFSELFKYWRGDIIFTFRFICSQYHRGRVRIVWDPIDTNATGNVTSCINEVVDIAETPEIEVKVPYLAATSWLQTVNTTQSRYAMDGSTLITPVNTLTSNGSISVLVLNAQTSPIASADIQLQVSVRAGDRFELACPQPLHNTMMGTNFLIPESGIRKFVEPNKSDLIIESDFKDYEATQIDMFKRSPEHPELYSIYQGEAVKSLRSILRRFVLSRNITPADDSAGVASVYFYSMAQNRYPLYYRYTSDGIDTANVGADPINFVKVVPFNRIGACFIGSRGAINWRFQTTHDEPIQNLQIQRKSNLVITPSMYNKYNECSYVRTATTQAKHRINMICSEDNYEGALITDQRTQTGVTVSVPYYSMYKFRMNDASTRAIGSSVDGSNTDTMVIQLQYNSAKGSTNSPLDTCIQAYSAIGADFTFVHFLNVPVIQSGAVPQPTA